MEDFVSRQFEHLVVLIGNKEEVKFPLLNKADRWLKITGDVIFLLMALVLFFKGLQFLDAVIQAKFFAPQGYAVINNERTPIGVAHTPFYQFYLVVIRSAWFLVVLVGLFLLLVNGLFWIRLFVKPFQVLTVYGYYKAVAAVIALAFAEGNEGVGGMLKDFVEDIF